MRLRRRSKIIQYEAFVPLYLTNMCDSQCMICNMRKQNKKLERIQADKNKIREQLKIIYNIEKISAVCILTGEYSGAIKRKNNIHLVIWSIKQAFEIGFKKVLFNIGSLYDDEIQLFSENFHNEDRIVLSLFQETYDKACYERYFGKYDISNPKSDFDRRLTTPERFLKAGFKQVDIGILIGLNNINDEMEQFSKHIKKLVNMAQMVYISLPRICGVDNLKNAVSDEKYIEIVKQIAEYDEKLKIIVTTRESLDMISNLLPYIKVISPGCSDVLPYTAEGKIRNDIKTSQFQVKPVRDRPSEILNALTVKNNIHYFNCS